MKRVSCKMFFSVVWKGICQAVKWFFGLFGYKREGKFAHCVWGLFALSATIIMTIAAGAVLYALGIHVYREIRDRFCNGKECYWTENLSSDIAIHKHHDEKGDLINTRTGKKILTGIVWTSNPLGEKDSLVFYSDGEKRGYFNKYTGEVTIPAKYSHAWVFSDGIASVEEDGIIKFIDTKGNQVFDRTFAYDSRQEGYVFHGGYCIIDSDNDYKRGLMNMKGETVVPEEYNQIRVTCQLDYWTLIKGDSATVVDQNLNPVLPLMACEKMWAYEKTIDVTMPDYTMRKYDYQGNLVNDFYIKDFEPLEYETEETRDIIKKEADEYGDEHEYASCTEHKTARARLCKYEAGCGKEGLMTAEGYIVTMPKYERIEAVGPDTYLCTISYDDKEIVNGKGQKVK